MFDYTKLKVAIKNKYRSQKAFACALGISYVSLNQRLNNHLPWRNDEVLRACRLLNIPIEISHLYFLILDKEKLVSS